MRNTPSHTLILARFFAVAAALTFAFVGCCPHVPPPAPPVKCPACPDCCQKGWITSSVQVPKDKTAIEKAKLDLIGMTYGFGASGAELLEPRAATQVVDDSDGTQVTIRVCVDPAWIEVPKYLNFAEGSAASQGGAELKCEANLVGRHAFGSLWQNQCSDELRTSTKDIDEACKKIERVLRTVSLTPHFSPKTRREPPPDSKLTRGCWYDDDQIAQLKAKLKDNRDVQQTKADLSKNAEAK